MDSTLYLVRLAQFHPSFRKPELEALALMAGVDVNFVDYSEYSPYCLLQVPSASAAITLLSRSILSKAIYELWASATTYPVLHQHIRSETTHLWPQHRNCTFKFILDVFNGSHSAAEQTRIIDSFNYLPFNGPITMKNPDEEFIVCEEHDHGGGISSPMPKKIYFGRLVARGGRDAVNTYSLKKRAYISTTSMDAELALLTANLTLARPGKLFYDPFVGTGSIAIACAHYGAMTMGSDIDGRAVRGKGGKGVGWSLSQYDLGERWIGGFVGDVTFSPLRAVPGEVSGGPTFRSASPGGGLLDGIVCDPPYGVREGLKVLGSRDGSGKEIVWIEGVMAHLQDKYIPPKRPYSFKALLSDVLEFAASMLVEDGRLGLWMPTANDEEVELEIPVHAALEVVSVCVQPFNKWSRRLLTYRRKRIEEMVHAEYSIQSAKGLLAGNRADDLNNFRKRYFEGFKPAGEGNSSPSVIHRES
ncbi:hypothetical protein MMC13_008161 [Lambiella insularis]|nr:hypothetical protein [Lambiella insularis]